MLLVQFIIYALFIHCIRCYDLSGYSSKTKLFCDEFYDFTTNNWNVTGSSLLYGINLYSCDCPTHIAPCAEIQGFSTLSALLDITFEASNLQNIELIWDMNAKFEGITSGEIYGKYSCDGTLGGLTEFFIISQESTCSSLNDQYFKLPLQCNNVSKIIIQFSIDNAASSGNDITFYLDNFCVYANAINIPTISPSSNPNFNPVVSEYGNTTTIYLSTPPSDADSCYSTTKIMFIILCVVQFAISM
eukprot:118956_1